MGPRLRAWPNRETNGTACAPKRAAVKDAHCCGARYIRVIPSVERCAMHTGVACVVRTYVDSVAAGGSGWCDAAHVAAEMGDSSGSTDNICALSCFTYRRARGYARARVTIWWCAVGAFVPKHVSRWSCDSAPTLAMVNWALYQTERAVWAGGHNDQK
eukprot:TRINITY_DN40689_c0_g1_i1.p1 TRINITY_DN40689_c0_g1~~TRINITY_DN40689_c0_g1_i1.p1  ORF type:complete len:158 (+),score=11.07 TRINITY_DN40689_c0_g1_i1:132-605(+)